MTPSKPSPPRASRAMKHTSFRVEPSMLARIEAVKSHFATRYHRPTQAEMIRSLLDQALRSLERRGRKTPRQRP
jgi:hypothetical protein